MKYTEPSSKWCSGKKWVLKISEESMETTCQEFYFIVIFLCRKN